MRTVVVVNKSWRDQTSKVLNAVGHVSMAIARLEAQKGNFRSVDYRTSDNQGFPAISVDPLILLSGRQGKMWEFLQFCHEADISSTAFVETMFDGGSDVQVEKTKSLAREEHSLVCVAACGAIKDLETHTRKFSLL